MQKVSKAYQASMKSPLRERAYIMLSFGLINQEAQLNARIATAGFTSFSNTATIFKRGIDKPTYATLEEGVTRVDGSALFLPRNPMLSYYDTGIISDELVANAVFELLIELNMTANDIKGISIDFGDNYPVDFDLVGNGGNRIEIRGNNQPQFSTEEVLTNTTEVRLVVYSMLHPDSRVRIASILFGYGLVYYNEDVMSSTMESYVSPIGADVPQIDFSVTLKNYNHYFNVDNPKSAINYLETGQEMDIHYGYQTPGSSEIEWIKGNHLLCSEWESDDYSATIRCHDIFRTMDSEYYKGVYRSGGVSFYDLAVAVLEDAGQSNYYLDPRLKRLFTKNPLPRVTHKEALQIIANACRCILYQTRDGAIQISSAFEAEAIATTESEAPYSHVASILNETPKDEYATLSPNYTAVNGGMFFVPRDLSHCDRNTGFVSAQASLADCTFADNPVVTITQDAACKYYGATFHFGYGFPASFTIRTYNDNALVEERYIGQEDIHPKTILHDAFETFDKMELEFTATAEPFSRIVLNHFAFGDAASYTMTRTDMTSSPKAIKQELVKEVIVPCYSYQNGEKEESLLTEEVTVAENEIMTFYVGEPSYDFRAALTDVEGGVTILESGSYYVTVQFEQAGDYQLELFGYRYKVMEQNVTEVLGNRGKTVTWENPLMSDMAMATDLAAWLGDYHRVGIEYEYSTRGNPELDVNDIIYQENEFQKDMRVKLYRHTLEFKQSFSGKVTARRWG